VVCKFKGIIYVHIRQYELKGDREYPTRIGSCMSARRFAMFLLTKQKIEDAKRDIGNGSESVDVREHIGGGVYLTLKSGTNLINIRKYFIPPGSILPIPTRMGIALKFSEWDKLMDCIEDMKNLSQDLKHAEPCFNGLDHANVMSFLECKECTPYGCGFSP
jgi:hypothetical protein